MQQWVLMTTAVAFLAGCDTVDMTPVGDAMPDNLPPAAEDNCGAASFANLIGQPREAAEAAPLPVSSRIVGPDDAVTMDFNPERLNVMLDANDIVARLTCG